MSMKLFIGSLSYDVSDEDLREFFAKEGAVASAIVIKDRESGRSKGFGFVEMEDDNEAKEAITKLNGADFNGRSIIVNEARPQEDRRPSNNNNNRNRPSNNFRRRY